MTINELKREVWHNSECIRDAAETGRDRCGQIIRQNAGIHDQHKARILEIMFQNIGFQLHAFDAYIDEMAKDVAENEKPLEAATSQGR